VPTYKKKSLDSSKCIIEFRHLNTTIPNFLKKAYQDLIVGRVAGIVICPKSHLYKFSNNWFHAMRTLRPRVFVGALLNKSTNGKVHNILLRCKIAKAYFRMQFNLNAPNVLSFFFRF